MTPPLQHIATHNDFQIYLRQPGFASSSLMLGQVAAFVVRNPNGIAAVCAFMCPLLITSDTSKIEEADLLAAAVATIKSQIESNRIIDKRDLTFEYRDGSFVEVRSPRWWIPTWD